MELEDKKHIPRDLTVIGWVVAGSALVVVVALIVLAYYGR